MSATDQKPGKPKVLVVAHDAGGAEIIAAYVKKHEDQKEFHVHVAGPAARIFRRENIVYKRAPVDKEGVVRLVRQCADFQFVLLGTGWMTNIESDTLAAAKQIGLKTAVYLESWVNYRERFGYPQPGWRKRLPDEIWLGDKYALAMAIKYFSKTRLRFVQNQYFANIVMRHRKLRRTQSRASAILFLSDANPVVEKILDNLLASLSVHKETHSLFIRFHPADSRNRFDAIIKRYSKLVYVKKSGEKDIVRDFLRARVVVGTETAAMAASVLVGIKTISIQSSNKRYLPFPQIIHIRRAQDVTSLI